MAWYGGKAQSPPTLIIIHRILYFEPTLLHPSFSLSSELPLSPTHLHHPTRTTAVVLPLRPDPAGEREIVSVSIRPSYLTPAADSEGKRRRGFDLI